MLSLGIFLALFLISGSGAVDLVTQPGSSGPDVVETVVDLIRENCIFARDNAFLRRLAYVETRDGSEPRTYSNPQYHGGIWQVDRDMFEQTKNQNIPILNQKIALIKQVFNIDWTTVQWTDLRKPLYSGLAASLYIILQAGSGGVPLRIEGQGTFWRYHYKSGASAHNFTATVERMQPGCNSSNKVVDIVFLVDSSSSLSRDDFARVKNFIITIIDGFTVGSNAAQFALVKYSTSVHVEFRFGQHQTKSELNNSVMAMTYTSGSTNTAGALTEAISIFTPSNGGRMSAQKVAILITDGNSDDRINTIHAAQVARNKGIAMFTLGVGSRIDTTELSIVATSPSCTHTFVVPGYIDISTLRQEIQRSTCKAPLYVNRTVQCEVSKCPSFAFPVSKQGITIEGNITCGTATVFTDFNNYFPSNAHNLVQETLAAGKLMSIFQGPPNIGDKYLYVSVKNIIGSESCIMTLTPYPGIHTSTEVKVVCEQNYRERNCTQKELEKFKKEFCKDATWTRPNNPCTPEAIRQKSLRFPDPYDNAKFLQCDLRGQMYVTQCPQGEVYSARCQMCFGSQTSVPADCSVTSLNLNPCTSTNILKGNMFFAYPSNDHKYIHCDVWGHAWVQNCQSEYIWVQSKLACEHPDLVSYNPCPGMLTNGQRFYCYPYDPHKFIECNDIQTPFVLPCPKGNPYWDDHVKTCVGRIQTTSNCGSQITYQPISSYIPGPTLPSQLYAAPCTKQNIANMQLYHVFSANHHYYIQCDLIGHQFLRRCEKDYYYDPFSHTCVDGPVAVDPSLQSALG